MPVELPRRDPCPYCENLAGRFSSTAGRPPVLYEDDTVLAYLNPASHGGMEGHALVIPKRHVEVAFDLTIDEETALALVVGAAGRALRDSLDPDGLLVLQRNGVAAEQTVPHVHVHVIPRRAGTPWPPTEWIEVTPHAQRMALAEQIRACWPG